MKRLSKQELLSLVKNRKDNETIQLPNSHILDMDLNGEDISNIDFSWSNIENVNLRDAHLTNCNFDHVYFSNVDLRGANLAGSTLEGANLGSCNLRGMNACGVNFYSANLVGAKLDNIQVDEDTKYFRLQCPQSEYFIGYKSCMNYRIVTLLIPKDSKRSSATTDECRCEKAKVIEISNIDRTEFYQEATSYVDENFVYRLGEMVYAKNFNDDRWVESTGGIHFYMTREKAIAYM